MDQQVSFSVKKQTPKQAKFPGNKVRLVLRLTGLFTLRRRCLNGAFCDFFNYLCPEILK
jgi:hypothetical protein